MHVYVCVCGVCVAFNFDVRWFKGKNFKSHLVYVGWYRQSFSLQIHLKLERHGGWKKKMAQATRHCAKSIRLWSKDKSNILTSQSLTHSQSGQVLHRPFPSHFFYFKLFLNLKTTRMNICVNMTKNMRWNSIFSRCYFSWSISLCFVDAN